MREHLNDKTKANLKGMSESERKAHLEKNQWFRGLEATMMYGDADGGIISSDGTAFTKRRRAGYLVTKLAAQSYMAPF